MKPGFDWITISTIIFVQTPFLHQPRLAWSTRFMGKKFRISGLMPILSPNHLCQKQWTKLNALTTTNKNHAPFHPFFTYYQTAEGSFSFYASTLLRIPFLEVLYYCSILSIFSCRVRHQNDFRLQRSHDVTFSSSQNLHPQPHSNTGGAHKTFTVWPWLCK